MQFRFGNFTLCIKHYSGCPVFERVWAKYGHRAIKESPSRVDATFVIRPKTAPRPPKPEAVRVRYWEEFKNYLYMKGPERFEYYNNNLFVYRNLETYQAELTYQEADEIVLQIGSAALKWLVIKALERQHYGYLHASMVVWKDRSFLFCGDPGSGKSSCALRTQQMGATVITDDTVLFKEGSVLAFDKNPSIRGDFSDRFQIHDPNFVFPTTQDQRMPSVAALFFPQVWESPDSKLVPLSRPEALALLWKSYFRETDWHTYPENRKTVIDRYDALLGKAPAYRLLTGKKEAPIRDLLRQKIPFSTSATVEATL